MQEGDVLLYQSVDGGEIVVENGLTEMSGGLETMAYLCLFGGNEDDDGSQDSPKTWWANLDEEDPDAQYRSETQNLLTRIPATTGNLKRLKDAAERDLAAFTNSGAADSVVVAVSIPALNKIKISASITVNGITTELKFLANWQASA